MTSVLQTLRAWTTDGPLPSSTGQIIERGLAEEIIETNRAQAKGDGLRLHSDGSITDPETGISIQQDYIEAAPFYDTPAHPMCGEAPPALPEKPIESIELGTLKVFSWGQSHVSNAGRSRATSQSSSTWAWTGGRSYPASDPFPGADGTDGSIWPRFVDLAIGRPIENTRVDSVIVGCCARGGTFMADWTAGGRLNRLLTDELSGFLTACGQPTFLHFCQGPGDTLSMTTEQWYEAFKAMLTSVRSTGCTSPILIDTDTMCNLRDAANPPSNEAMSRSARLLLRYEAGRKAIRAAQALAASINRNTLPGANVDVVPWEYRAYGDGCHFGELGLIWHAKALLDAWFDPDRNSQVTA